MMASEGAISYKEACAMPIGEAYAILHRINEIHEAARAAAEEMSRSKR